VDSKTETPDPAEPERRPKPVIGLVGPCGSGKSTLASGLRRYGWTVRHIAQEHSFVKEMWRRLANPDILIFLQASFTVSTRRRRLNWTEADFAEQQRRLAHALQHADLVVDTDALGIDQVLEQVLGYLRDMEGK
jgi:cytidylate kinase